MTCFVYIIIYLKLQLLPATSATCPVRELSSPLVDQSTRCPDREVAIRELAYPQVVHLPTYRSGTENGGEIVRHEGQIVFGAIAYQYGAISAP